MRGWGGGAGEQRACRLLPGRSRCPRAGPAALRWAEVGCRVTGFRVRDAVLCNEEWAWVWVQQECTCTRVRVWLC